MTRAKTVILGGGFGGSLRRPPTRPRRRDDRQPREHDALHPLLPEVPAGAIEPRHVTILLRMM
jgi:NADH dehydrogenase FAD-containing subunit